MFTITDRTCTPPAPAQPALAAPSLHGGPPMPWAIREAEAFGGKIIRHKLHANGLFGDVLTPDDEAILARIAYLEVLVTTLQVENETLRAELAAAGATVLPAVAPTDGIETETVIETDRAETPAEHAAWVNDLLARFTVQADSAPVPPPVAGLAGADAPEVGTVGTGPQAPSGFVALVPDLAPAVTTPEPVAATCDPAPAPEVGAPDEVPPVGTEPSAPKTARRTAVEAALKEFPHLSNAVLAERCEVSAEYVRLTRKQLEAAGLLEPQATVVGRDGLTQSVVAKSHPDAA